MPTRGATAEWQGDLKGGKGTVSVASGLFDGAFSYTTRFEDEPGTNPEELIGAAHAGCYSMQLSAMLAEAGHTAESVRTSAAVHLRIVDGSPTITRIELSCTGRVPGIDAERFKQVAAEAKEACLVSRALSGVQEITLEAELR